MFEPQHLQHTITAGYIRIISGGHQLPAYWAHPEQGGPFPGLVLLHDDQGLTAFGRSQARRLAEQGYYTIAPDLFAREPTDSTTDSTDSAPARRLDDQAQAHVSAAMHALTTHHKCSGRIALVGWGMGGALALRAAISHAVLHALVSFYGLPEDAAPALLWALPCPALILLAGHDPSTPPDRIAGVRAVLDSGTAGQGVIVYDSAGRGFADDTRETFDPVTAEDAWARALAFLRHTLAPPAPPPL